jgi:hypothetical protein
MIMEELLPEFDELSPDQENSIASQAKQDQDLRDQLWTLFGLMNDWQRTVSAEMILSTLKEYLSEKPSERIELTAALTFGKLSRKLSRYEQLELVIEILTKLRGEYAEGND